MDRNVIAVVVAVLLPVVIVVAVFVGARRANRLSGVPVSRSRMRKLAVAMAVIGLAEVTIALAVIVLEHDVVRGALFAVLGGWFALQGILQWRQYREVT